jgi:large subunit ribosomal protein L21
MYAIIETGGKQYRVEPGQIIEIEKPRGAEPGEVTFDRVLMCADGEDVKVGAPTVDGAAVEARLLGVGKGPKKVAFKKRRRKDSQTSRGHRQSYARVKIDKITQK